MTKHRNRNHWTRALLLGAAIIGATAPAVQAQRARVPADVQKDYDQFIVKFRDALKANDSAAVAELTKFPFYWNEMRDSAYFRKTIYGKIFTQKVRDCIIRGKGVYDRSPQGEDNFTVFCGKELLLFTKTPGGFRFAETGAND